MRGQPGASYMAREIAEIPEAAARLATVSAQAELRALAAAISAARPRSVGIIAHGSSRHAGTVIATAIWQRLGLPCSVVPLGARGTGDVPLQGAGQLVLGISQSGRSPDLVSAMTRARQAGAQTLTISNTADSPLMAAAASRFDLRAGPEHAVAATKSFVNSALAGLWLVGHWAEDQALLQALRGADAALSGGMCDPELVQILAQARGLFVLGRDGSAGVAAEVALKAMELCGVHASAYSGSAVLHGPAAIAVEGFTVLGFEGAGVATALARLAGQGAACHAVPSVPAHHPLVDPLAQLIPVYRAIEAATRIRGRNPDSPAFLEKVTQTR